jgi:lipopolysaccharide export system permease protein
VSKYDRYVLSLLVVLFGFFALILVAVFWINRAVDLFDRLIGDGQTAWVFLEFTALSLPNLVRMVLPMAAFSAAVYVTNRLTSESELTVMQATGSSPWRMARPVAVFGLLVALMMSVLTHVLIPASFEQLSQREVEVSQNVTARLLTEGEFLHPGRGVTFYIRSIDDDGTLRDVFLSDRRDPATTVTYTAARAFLVRDGGAALLIMVDGLAQRLSEADSRLSTTNFADFSYDISALVRTDRAAQRNIRQIPTLELLTGSEELRSAEALSAGEIAEELHLRIARPLICVAVALIGFSALLVGGFSRFGVWRQIVFAFFALIGLEVLRGVVSEPVLDDARLWPLIYLPVVLGLALSAILLHLAARPRRRRRAPALEAAA